MRKNDGAFTPAELKIAVGAVVIASVIAILAMALGGSLLHPPLGYYGSDSLASAASSGVLDAQPVAG